MRPLHHVASHRIALSFRLVYRFLTLHFGIFSAPARRARGRAARLALLPAPSQCSSPPPHRPPPFFARNYIIPTLYAFPRTRTVPYYPHNAPKLWCGRPPQLPLHRTARTSVRRTVHIWYIVVKTMYSYVLPACLHLRCAGRRGHMVSLAQAVI